MFTVAERIVLMFVVLEFDIVGSGDGEHLLEAQLLLRVQKLNTVVGFAGRTIDPIELLIWPGGVEVASPRHRRGDHPDVRPR